jgi:hypothetical protein
MLTPEPPHLPAGQFAAARRGSAIFLLATKLGSPAVPLLAQRRAARNRHNADQKQATIYKEYPLVFNYVPVLAAYILQAGPKRFAAHTSRRKAMSAGDAIPPPAQGMPPSPGRAY